MYLLIYLTVNFLYSCAVRHAERNKGFYLLIYLIIIFLGIGKQAAGGVDKLLCLVLINFYIFNVFFICE